MLPFRSTFAILLALNFAYITTAEPFHWADNVCNETVPVKKDITYETPVEYEIKVQSMCGMLPCVKTRTEVRMNQSIKTVIMNTKRLTCCPGYAETPSRRCLPVCSDPCGPAGKCIAPDVCACQNAPTSFEPGYTGSTCRRFTCQSEGYWGKMCQLKCDTDCPANMYCRADNGKCVCEPGWYGANCTSECSPDDDNSIADCTFISQNPPINEPNANLMVETMTVLPKAGKADALRLDYHYPQPWILSQYVVGLLSVVSLVLLVAFLVIKRRYEFVRNELYYATAASVSAGSNGSDRSQSDYSTYYSTGPPPSSVSPDAADLGKKLGSHLNFDAATRNILTGRLVNPTETSSKIQMFSPKIESHLMASNKKSKQNIYAEVSNGQESRVDMANRARAQTPVMSRRSSANGNDETYDHIYQVPKKKSPDTTLDTSTNSQDSEIYMEINSVP